MTRKTASNTRYAPVQVQTSGNHSNKTKQFLTSKTKHKFRAAPWHSAVS